MNRKIVSGLALRMLLVLTLGFNIEPVISTTKFTQPVTAYSTSSYENVTTHEGDLIINGTQMYVIENATFFIDGNIIVRDYSTLVIRNSKVILQLEFFGEHWVEMRDYSRLLVDIQLR